MPKTEDPNSGLKRRLGHHFQRLVNAIADADLPPAHLEAIELVIAAKQHCWQLMNGRDPLNPILHRVPKKSKPVLGTKWKPYERVEFKHVVEVSERIGRMSDDSMLLGNVWNELQCVKGQIKQLKAKIPQRHLSDGAMAALRDDLKEAKPGEPLTLAWGYVSKALDEIEYLREEIAELMAGADADAFTIGNLNAQIAVEK